MRTIGRAEMAATAPLLRRLNAHAILEHLRRSGAVTATEIIAATGLSRPTVHTVCASLIELGWVTELDGRRSEGLGPGRPNRRYEFNARAGYVLGVDLGAASVRVRLSDLRGDMVAEHVHPLGYKVISGRERIRQTRRAMASVLRTAKVAPTAVLTAVVGVASPVDSSGRAYDVDHYLLGLTDEDIGEHIGRGYTWPVLLENDADLAVIGERWQGMGVAVDNIVVLLAGERLGAGLFLAGHLIRGAMGSAGEMGFLRLVNQVGNTDGITHLARRLGAEAVARDILATPVAGDGSSSGLAVLTGGDPERVQAEMVFLAARDGDPTAKGIVAEIAERMARVIGILATLLNPEVLVLTGAFAPSMDVLLPPLNSRVRAHTRHPPTVLASVLGDRAVILGATRLAIDHVEAETFERITTTR